MASAFELLDPAIQQALYGFKWPELRPLQVDAIRAFDTGPGDLILSAATASGKTEAAFLPVLSDLAGNPSLGVGALYIGPLKALINDQFMRLEELCKHADIPVHRWHGDVSATAKKAFRKDPGGVLLITPESLESNFINYGNQLARIYSGLKHVVIDELHSFLGDVRGVHLASLLSRLDQVADKRPRRLGLSATLADFNQARDFLNRRNPESVNVLEDKGAGKHWKIGLRAYPSAPRRKTSEIVDDAKGTARLISQYGPNRPEPPEEAPQTDPSDVTEHRVLAAELARVFRDKSNLVFTNSRSLAELIADRIHELERKERWPRNPFVLHHGSLAREMREDVETRLKKGEPLTAFCTSTMEMGIDIGSVHSVGQLGPPWTVNSLVQRMGRSGRKAGEPSILRMYALDPQPTSNSPLDELLSPQLIRCIAMLELMIDGWLEPAEPEDPEYSTLIHQTLSVLRQTGGTSAIDLCEVLCVSGSFSWIDPPRFAKVLRSLGDADLIEQMADGTVILSPQGEAIAGGREFYAAFNSSEDFAVRCGQEKIGRLPRTSVPPLGEHMILNGRRWVVTDIDSKNQLVEVAKAKGFKKPIFLGSAGDIHTRIAARMKEVLSTETNYPYLHRDASEQLTASQNVYRLSGLDSGNLIRNGAVAELFPWVGTKTVATLELCARNDGIMIERRQLSLRYHADGATLQEHFDRVASRAFDPTELARSLPDRHFDKYDIHLNDELLDEANTTRRLRLVEAAEVAAEVIS